jgi:hypothetical protein
MPQKLCYPLHYKEVADCFEGLNDGDTYLTFWFNFQADLLKRNNAIEAKGEYSIVTLRHDPDLGATFSQMFETEAKRAGADEVDIRISALPRNVAHELALHQRHLPQLLMLQLKELSVGGLWKNRWHLSLTLYTESRRLECIVKKWDGLQESPPFKTFVPLQEETDELSSSN